MNNFAVLDISYTHNPTAIVITIETNNPCHLTCYYTDKEPGRHRTSRNQRGLTLPWGAYYCFVAWQTIEQTEPGDTLSHTFEIPDWSYCQTKWFAFRGTVAAVLSPSVSALFEHHHSGVVLLIEEQSEHDTGVGLAADGNIRAAQRLIIPNRKVVKLSFKLIKIGNPTGEVTFTIRGLISGLIQSKPWGDASALPSIPPPVDWQEVTFDTPVPIDEEARICVEFEGGDESNVVYVARFSAYDIKPNENLDTYKVSWVSQPANDCAYRYEYY